mmetsp:Transcript_17032/g.32064  ORF Transcript_17032/g.32064 Transcript_17032/m.32064 type:complete len:102 (-) Transcript_17032:11-316(-)
MSLTKSEENLVIWGGASLLLLLIAIISFISYRVLLPAKVKNTQKLENILSTRNYAKKKTVIEILTKARDEEDGRIIPVEQVSQTQPEKLVDFHGDSDGEKT